MPDVFMPRLSDTMEEGTIAQWLVAEGATVERGAVIAEIETDKAVMDLEAYEGGVLQKIIVQAGQTVPIGEVIAVIGDGSAADSATGPAAASANGAAGHVPGDKSSDDATASTPAATEVDAPLPDDAEPDSQSVASSAAALMTASAAQVPNADGQPKSSPVVRSLARTHGIDLSTVTGTGPGGRIIRIDVEKLIPADGAPATPAAATSSTATPAAATSSTATVVAKPAAPQAPVAAVADDTRIPLSTIRKVTAKRLSEAALVPAFQLTTVLDATELGALRKQINANVADSGVKISVTDLLIKAVAVALRAHPEVNASFDGDAIIRRAHVNVGVAVALEDGLIVPVIRDADVKSLTQISTEAKELAGKARAGKLKPEEFSGGTFTISNLGMFGIDTFTAVLNPPEAAILAVGSTVDEPVVVDGAVTVRARSRLTLTVDHRVLDGAMGAAFLRDLTNLLASPLRMLV